MEDQFKELTTKLQQAGFVAKQDRTGRQAYVLAGTHEENYQDVKLLQNTIMIVYDLYWEIHTSWPGQTGYEFTLPNFESTVEKAIELLTSKK